MPYLFSMLANFVSDLHEDGQMHIPIAVGLGDKDMRPWEFDELQEIARSLYPAAPSLTSTHIVRRK